jgi:hypothetical protein
VYHFLHCYPRKYYIQLGGTIGYKSNVNLPTLWPGIRLSRSRSSVWSTTQDNWSDQSRRSQTTVPQTEQFSGQAPLTAQRPSLPSILLANVQSLDNKVDEIRARVQISQIQRDIRDCNILCFMETWLTRDTLSESVQPPGFFTYRADRNKHFSGKKKGGGVCLMINESWCDHNIIQELESFLFTWPRIPYNQMPTALSTRRILLD